MYQPDNHFNMEMSRVLSATVLQLEVAALDKDDKMAGRVVWVKNENMLEKMGVNVWLKLWVII